MGGGGRAHAAGFWSSLLRHAVNGIGQALPPTRMFRVRRWLLAFCNVGVGADVNVCGGALIFGRGQFQIGASTWISPGLRAYTHVDAAISIGKGCDIGPEVSLITGSHEIGGSSRRAGNGTAASISIGDGCWIGARVTILGGVSVGEGSIIAAGSVVTRDVPAHSLAAGVPSRVKRPLAT